MAKQNDYAAARQERVTGEFSAELEKLKRGSTPDEKRKPEIHDESADLSKARDTIPAASQERT
jgi:hypothetical protein